MKKEKEESESSHEEDGIDANELHKMFGQHNLFSKDQMHDKYPFPSPGIPMNSPFMPNPYYMAMGQYPQHPMH